LKLGGDKGEDRSLPDARAAKEKQDDRQEVSKVARLFDWQI
jgi:hypothetical protein